MNEYQLSARAEYEVRLTRQRPAMQALAIAHAMNETADPKLGLGVLGPDQGHARGSRGLRKCVGHVAASNRL